MYIELEDMARYISLRTGCTFDEAMDYQYSQRDYFDTLGLIRWDVKSESELKDLVSDVVVDDEEMCHYISEDMGIKQYLYERMSMAEMEYLGVIGQVEPRPLDDLYLLIQKLDSNQRKEALAAIEVILSD